MYDSHVVTQAEFEEHAESCERDPCPVRGCVAYRRYCQELADSHDDCPTHGRQRVVRTGSTGGTDPYAVSDLGCGCSVVCYGPGEPNTVVHTGGRRPLGVHELP